MSTSISKSVFFNASPETVWEFLVDKDKLGVWYHPAKANLELGEDYVLLEGDGSGGMKKIVWGRVLEMDKWAKLVTTFCIAPFDGKETTVTWIINEVAGGTRLSLTHEGIAEATGSSVIKFLTALDDGWDKHFSKLRTAFGTS